MVRGIIRPTQFVAQGHSQRPDGLKFESVMPLVETGWHSPTGTIETSWYDDVKDCWYVFVFDELHPHSIPTHPSGCIGIGG